MTTVYYSQKDPRWVTIMYSNHGDKAQTIGTSACGPTCFAMVASTLLGKTILPPETAAYAIGRGYRTYNDGTDWGYFASIAKDKAYALDCKQTANWDEVKKALATGALVIGSMSPGHLTGGGHYVLLVGISGKWVDVHDPNHTYKYPNDGLVDRGKGDGRIRVDESVFRREAKQFWIFPNPIKREDEPMTKEEKAAFAALEDQVKELTSAVTVLTMAVKDATAQIPAPKWFVTEFGSADLGGLINTPKKTLAGWEGIAISARLQGLGKGK